MQEDILDILSEIRPECDFKNSSDFIQDGLLDSFDVLTLVSDLEERFGIFIDGAEILPENFSSLNAIKLLIDKSAKA